MSYPHRVLPAFGGVLYSLFHYNVRSITSFANIIMSDKDSAGHLPHLHSGARRLRRCQRLPFLIPMYISVFAMRIRYLHDTLDLCETSVNLVSTPRGAGASAGRPFRLSPYGIVRSRRILEQMGSLSRLWRRWASATLRLGTAHDIAVPAYAGRQGEPVH